MQIKPITDLRNTNEISELCNRTGEPVFITKNGYGDLVVMSIAAYERDIAAAKHHSALLQGLMQATSGDLLDGDSVLSELRAKYVRK